MKLTLYLIFFLFISCDNSNQQEIREPFDVNHRLTVSTLFENNYKRIWGEDVILYEKKRR